MGIASIIVVFIIIWWCVLFCILPIGMEREFKEENAEPQNIDMKKKFIQTTVISVFLWCLVCAYIAYADAGQGRQELDMCRELKQGAEYIPDVDVHGKPVKSADLNPQNADNTPILIPVTIDLAARFGIDLPQGAEMKPQVGHFLIFPDGKVLYNDQDLTQKITAICDGQKSENAVISTNAPKAE